MIQEQLFDPLATKLLAGDFNPNDKIQAGAKDGELVFQNKQTAETQKCKPHGHSAQSRTANHIR